MSWLIIVIAAHVLNALVFVLTKALLEKYITNEKVFAILIGILGLIGFVMAPFGLVFPSLVNFSIDILAGATFVWALYFFYSVLKKFDASTVVPVSGASVPIFTFILSFIFLNERLQLNELLAFGLLLVGTVVISLVRSKHPLTIKAFSVTVLSGFTFAISYFLTKFAYETHDFVSAFVWMRVGSFIGALVLLLDPKAREATMRIVKKTSAKIKISFIGVMTLAAAAFLLLNWGISLASVSLVNALQGVQYAFLIIIVILGNIFLPKIIKEKIRGWVLIEKIFAIFLIAGGIVLLTLAG
ncbi:hypothetical protein COT97_00970 [Candidatus Falkowbacteria bacterium CG10_big_fil_rev_8_21_14_0_10_39_11]|uniref:EamA domain-containing protein n=1 Tax=Candidatus Falkowbacteria bacterium CG10_big_fil_rev_8_21_14_0_10_39_11 TaxID=1974565 RepID=A0A2H0V610_9BACT|nr:MAG: hypothetical protein COT97_00970 [Candidatus Falkowbacteria bacterium CG10_big_fil_rev_8_21_14_0_10_39_11]